MAGECARYEGLREWLVSVHIMGDCVNGVQREEMEAYNRDPELWAGSVEGCRSWLGRYRHRGSSKVRDANFAGWISEGSGAGPM